MVLCVDGLKDIGRIGVLALFRVNIHRLFSILVVRKKQSLLRIPGPGKSARAQTPRRMANQ